METQKVWLEITIAGFVYLSAGFFLVLYIAGVHDLSFVGAVESSLPYLSVAIIALSYACGYAIDVISHPGIAFLKRAVQSEVGEEVLLMRNEPLAVLSRKKAAYSTLLLFRHLTAGSILLTISLGCWLRDANLNLRWTLVVICFAALFALAYRVQREYYVKLEKAIDKPITKKTRS